MKKAITRLLSAMLLLVLLLSSFPFAVIAEPFGSESKDTVNADAPLEIREPDKQVGSSGEPESVEIINRRERNVKHFRHEDGTVEAVIYGYAVHRLDEAGEWQDIDNRLTEKTDGRTVHYITNDERIRFSNSGIGQLTLTLDSKPYRITMGMLTDRLQSGNISADSSTQPQIVVRNHETRAEQTTQATSKLSRDAQIERLKVIDNRTELCYQNIQNDIHLKYELEADDIKETIVVNAPQSEYRYQFGLRLEGLTATLCADGGIDLTDIETGEIPYRIPAPYMVDANDAVSQDVVYTLETIGEGAYLLTVIADSTWIDAKNRAFPVSIDPSLSTVGFTDTYIEDNHPDTIHGSDAALWVGQTKYTYIRPSLISTIPQKSIVNYAYLYGYYYYYTNVTSGNFYLGLYRGTSNWDDNLTWNKATALTNKGFYPNKRYGYANLSGSAGAYYSSPVRFSLSMKDIAQLWINGTTNYGVVLKRDSGDLMHSILVSSEGRTAYRPQLIISYTEPWIDSGVYRLKNAETGLYLTVGEPCWQSGALLRQNIRSTAADREEASRKQLFKINQIKGENGNYYYTIRLMTNSELAITAASSNNSTAKAIAISTSDSWNAISATERWHIVRDGANVTLNNGCYLSAPDNTTDAEITITSTKTNRSKWVLEKYTGATIEGVFYTSWVNTMKIGKTVQIKAKMYSSLPGANGPIIYSVENMDKTTTRAATIDERTGLLTALSGGTIRVVFTHSKTTTRWIGLLTIDLSGNYFLKNGHYGKFAQVDNDDAPDYSHPNTVIEQWSYSGEIQQKWKIQHIENGYYSIISAVNDFAITVPYGQETSDDVNLILLPNTQSANQLWRIMPTEHGLFKVKAKSAESYTTKDLAMRVNTKGLHPENGLNIMQMPYSGDTNLVDEWELIVISSYDIPIVLRGVQATGHDHRITMEYVNDSFGYKNYNNIDYAYGEFTGAQLKEALLSAQIFTSHSHSAPMESNGTIIGSKLLLNDSDDPNSPLNQYFYSCPNGSLASTDACIDPDDDFSQLDLAIFLGCCTAAGGTDVDNLPVVLVRQGARVAIGFSEKINCEGARTWLKAFYDKFTAGATVSESVKAACKEAEGFIGINSVVVCGDDSYALPN